MFNIIGDYKNRCSSGFLLKDVDLNFQRAAHLIPQMRCSYAAKPASLKIDNHCSRGLLDLGTSPLIKMQ